MGKIKRFMINMLVLLVILAVGYWSIGYMFQPSFNTTNNSLKVTQEELIDVQTNLRLRLARHAVESLGSGSNLVAVPIAPEEIDPLLKDWLNNVQWPQQFQPVASSFSIQDDQGVLKLALDVAQQSILGMEWHFTMVYGENKIILKNQELYLGKFPVPDSVTIWLFSNLPGQGILRDEITLASKEPVVYASLMEIHIPIDLTNDEIILHDLYFEDSNLFLELELNIKHLQEQLLERFLEVLPPGFELLPQLEELRSLLEN